MGRFGPGNTAALKHGLRSQREREKARRALAEEMREIIAAQLPETLPPGTPQLIDLAAVAAADVRQLHDYVQSQGGLISTRGQLRKCAEMMRAREHDLLSYFDRLGFGPRASAQVAALIGGNGKGNGLAGMLAGHQAAKALEAAR